jgi:cell division protein FtsQ
LWAGESAADKLVNSFGEVFEANLGDVEDDALPTLQGPSGSALRMLELLRRLGPVFAPIEASIETLELSGRGSWRLALDSGARIELGRGSDDEVVARATRFAATLAQVVARHQRPLEYADLRHSDGYAVRLKGISTGVDPAEKTARKK